MKKSFLAIALAVGIGCSGGANLITGVDILDFTATSQVTSGNPMRFSSTVVVTNTTTQPVTFTPACSNPRILVYSSATRTGTPVFDSKARDATTICAMIANQVTLAAGKSVSYTNTATGAEVLGTNGTPGTYYLVDEVTLDGEAVRVNAGQVVLAR
jgi:hypothetical protein